MSSLASTERAAPHTISPTSANPAVNTSTSSDASARSPGNTAHTSSPAAPDNANLTASSSMAQPRARNTRKNNSTHESTSASGTARALTASWTTPRNTPSSATLTTPSASTLHKPATPATYAPSLPPTNSRAPRAARAKAHHPTDESTPSVATHHRQGTRTRERSSAAA